MDNKRYICGNYNPLENCSGSCIECYYALTGTTSDEIPFLSYQESLDAYEETQAIELDEWYFDDEKYDESPEERLAWDKAIHEFWIKNCN